jgi:hypothetical protein
MSTEKQVITEKKELKGQVLLGEWADYFSMSEQAARMLAIRRGVQISRFGGADFVDADTLKTAFTVDIGFQQKRSDYRKKSAQRKRDELKQLKIEYESLKLEELKRLEQKLEGEHR